MTIFDCPKTARPGRLVLAAVSLLLVTSFVLLQPDVSFPSITASSADFDQLPGFVEDNPDATPIPAIGVAALFVGQTLLQGAQTTFFRPLQAFSLRLIRAPPWRAV